MAATTVYVVNIDPQGDMRTVLQRREALGNRIAMAARAGGDAVWFHDFEDPMLGGAASLLLECDDGFMDKVRQMPGYAHDHAVWDGVATMRSPRIQAYYTNPPAPRP